MNSSRRFRRTSTRNQSIERIGKQVMLVIATFWGGWIAASYATADALSRAFVPIIKMLLDAS